METYKRTLKLPSPGTETFFLWGPRQSGKSTLLRDVYKHGKWIDLLKADHLRRYMTRPELLRYELDAANFSNTEQVVIDEIQKVPQLLDEVHWLIENRGYHFALCGSSARKVRRGGVNLLGGRALRFHLHGLTTTELGRNFDLVKILNRGYLPRIYEANRPRQLLLSYVADYLVTEVAAEAMIRSLPAFSNFLDVAAICDTELIDYTNIATECHVSDKTAKAYYQILIDAMHGYLLPAFRKRAKRRVNAAPKFYFADVGVVNVLAKRRNIEPRTYTYGQAFENYIHHELRAYQNYAEFEGQLSYWRPVAGPEVDFIVGDMEIAIEVKASKNITNQRLKGVRSLIRDYPEVARRIVVCLDDEAYVTSDGIEVMPLMYFIERLWNGEIFELPTPRSLSV